MATPKNVEVNKLVKCIEESQFGFSSVLEGPFGIKRVVYADYTASGKPLTFIEDYLRDEVFPRYGNTHTTTSVTSRQTTFFREEARLIIRNSVNASEKDCVILTGSGSTGAVHKLIHTIGVAELPQPPIVFVSPFEHHSNLLPWREIGAEVIWITQTSEGQADIADLERKLKHYSGSGRQLIGALNAGSNVTGVLTDTDAFSALLHKYGALAFWDYAAAAPYVKVNMNPVSVSDDKDLVYKDAIYFSVHKFVGGADSPGVLVAKKDLFKSSTPHCCGGGTVFFVTPSSHKYFQEAELREEGGTPAILGSIRAGLAVQLKESVGSEFIMSREEELCKHAFEEWKSVKELVVVGPDQSVSRLPIFSFLVRHPDSGLFLHHNFVCALLNDLFGIQARGGCSCAGPYAQNMLGISEEMAKTYEALVIEDSRLDRVHLRRYHEYSEREILRPGLSRLNFPYFLSKEAVDYIIQSVTMVAKHGWKLLPQYIADPESGQFRHCKDHPSSRRQWLSSISFKEGKVSYTKSSPSLPPTYEDMLSSAQEVFASALTLKTASVSQGDQSLFLSDKAKQMRWFLLPSEAQIYLSGEKMTTPISPAPFSPREFVKRVHPSHSDNSLTEQKTTLTDPKTETVKTKDNVACKEGEEEVSNDLEGSDIHTQTKDPKESSVKFHSPPKSIFKPTTEAIDEFNMIKDGDRILVCLSGGKDSLSLLHTLHQYQFLARREGLTFDLGAVTIDPQTSSYNPRPLIKYLAALRLPYFYEEQSILQKAVSLPECASICSFCSRMKRGRLYFCARREGYNVLAMGQHLDDLAESFLMSAFHNGFLRTMKANYTVKEGDLRVIRPFVFVRENLLRSFAYKVHLPVIAENCPACFEAPKERHRIKQLLAAQELIFPRLYHSLLAALKPLMARDRTGLEGGVDSIVNDD